MNNWPNCLLTILLLSFLPFFSNFNIAWASGDEINSPLRFESITSEDGLSQNTINCIFQDSRGFMWFGTQDGLNKFDGYTFEIYKNIASDSTSLSHNWIWDIFEDYTGNLWVATWWGLNKYDPVSDKFTRFLPDKNDPNSISNNRPTAIVEDRYGNVWIATWGGGLNQYDRKKKSFTHFKHQAENDSSLSNNYIRTLFIDSKHTLWIGSWNGLCKIQPDTTLAKIKFTRYLNNPGDPHSISGNKIMSIQEDKTGNIWIGALEDGLSYLDRKTNKFMRFQHNPKHPLSIKSDNISSVLRDSYGNMWIATQDFGLSRYDKDQNSFISYTQETANTTSLRTNNLNTLYEDKSGILWIGTATSGINKLNINSKKFIHFSHSKYNRNSLSGNLIRCFYQDDQGYLWIGTGENGLNKYNPRTGVFHHFKPDPTKPTSISHNNVQSITGDKNDILWVGTLGGGLNRLNTRTGTFKHFFQNSRNRHSIGSNYIETLLLDEKGSLWIGTSNAGLDRYRIEANVFDHYRFNSEDPGSISTDYILSLFQDSRGTIWIGGWGGGLNRYDEINDRFIRYLHDPDNPRSLSDNIVNTIYETKSNGQSLLWIGTSGGLSYMNLDDASHGQFNHIYEKDGLPNQHIYGIVEDNQNNLWLSTNRGIVKFRPFSDIKSYDTGDGLPGNEFSGGAYYRDREGRIYFGCPRGFIVFDPDSIADNNYIPPVVITAFKKFNKTYYPGHHISIAKDLRLSYNDNVFSFNFSALDYTAPSKNQYAYKMEGFDENWIYTDSRNRSATFTNMNPGEYLFRVKGSNSDDIWNESGASIKIFISPPFWQTWWFRSLIALIIVYLLFLAHFIRVRHLRKSQKNQIEFSNKLIESQEAERKRIAAELHDSLGQNLLIANNELQLLLKKPLDISEGLEGLTSIIKESIEEVREISHNLHPHLLDRLGLTKAIEAMVKKMSHASQIKFDLDIEAIDDLLPAKSQIHFYRIIQEALNNTVKHSNANSAFITIRKSGNQIQTIIKDDGKGFQEGSHTLEGLGIKDMKERTRLISGNFHLSSKTGSGTEIRFNIPVSRGVK